MSDGPTVGESRNALVVLRDPAEGDQRPKDPLTPLASEAVRMLVERNIYGEEVLSRVARAIQDALIYLPMESHRPALNIFGRLRRIGGRSERPESWEIVIGSAGEAFEQQLLSRKLDLATRKQVHEDASRLDNSDIEKRDGTMQRGERPRDLEEDRGESPWDLEEEMDFLLESKAAPDKHVRQFIRNLPQDSDHNPDETFLWLLPLIAQLEEEQAVEVTRSFHEKWPGADAPAIFLERNNLRMSDFIERWASRKAARPKWFAMLRRISLYTHYHTKELVGDLLSNSLRIADSRQQALSQFGLLPYLRRDLTEGSIEDLRNPDMVGSEVACFAGMMLDLANAISADALSEMVRAAIGSYSEWWVVETLTVICRRLTGRDEFSAVRKASLYIKNLDLRARLLGRLASRAVDLDMASLAAEIAVSIELDAARWEELRHLGLRLASAGYSEAALRTIAIIPLSQERERAFAEIALEVAAQGFIEQARDIVGNKIADSVWRNWANQLLAAASKEDPQFDRGQIETRRRSRALVTEESDRFLIVADALDGLEQMGVATELLANVRESLRRQSEPALDAAIRALWDPRPSGRPDFLETVLATTRPQALARIGHLGPLLPPGERDLFASEIFLAVRRVIGWWP